MPKRVQRTRKAGQPAIPEGAVYVGRARGPYGYWGNPFKATQALEADFAETMEEARAVVTQQFELWLSGDMVIGSEAEGTAWSRERRDWIRDHIGQLIGKDLACWCTPAEEGQPDRCHATVLLRLAAEAERAQRYCTGDRCEDCTPPTAQDPDDECCEATCGCCPRVNEHDHCRLAPGSEEDSKYCDQHGEGWLYDRSPKAQRRYELLSSA